MNLFVITKTNFNFNKFVKTTADFITKSFGSDSPAETLRYFYSFDNSINENEDLELKEIQKSISNVIKKYKKGEIKKGKYELRHKELLKREQLRKKQIEHEHSQKRKKISFTPKDSEIWGIGDFKDAILKNSETIFFPFSSGLEEGGYISLALGEKILIGNEDEMEEKSDADRKKHEDDIFAPFDFDRNPGISMTDCFGFLIKMAGDKFLFIPAIAWGGMASSIEPTEHTGIYLRMIKFLKSFLKSYERITV